MHDDLTRILRTHLQLTNEELRPETTLDDAGLDSLALVELSLHLTERYAIDITDDDLRKAGTLGRIDQLLTTRLQDRTPQT
ncbi:acyl carrier protein [Streptomyces sp. NPDC047829]|uniref:acyl carrier protein n=1 Tax=Streptomyces sp. NPDC047829 TaxID=3154609 RepID=UPI00340986D8